VATVSYVDPTGRYIRKWCPELKRLPDKHLRAPWEVRPDAGRSTDRPRQRAAGL
jgi:deoxyribodipyrimidine photolyase